MLFHTCLRSGLVVLALGSTALHAVYEVPRHLNGLLQSASGVPAILKARDALQGALGTHLQNAGNRKAVAEVKAAWEGALAPLKERAKTEKGEFLHAYNEAKGIVNAALLERLVELGVGAVNPKDELLPGLIDFGGRSAMEHDSVVPGRSGDGGAEEFMSGQGGGAAAAQGQGLGRDADADMNFLDGLLDFQS